MTDIFISYSKEDRDLAFRLAAFLEAKGFSVWWDTSLLSGDDFRAVIMRELAASRAVIVIWTKNSIKSIWVQSEASRALEDGKLIPLRSSTVSYNDIPPPFDTQHTELVTDDIGILAAAIDKISKPATPPATSQLLVRQLRHEALTWFGIIGAATSIFGAISPLLLLAAWVRYFIRHWEAILHAAWSFLFGLFSVKILAPTAALLTASLFVWINVISSTETFHHVLNIRLLPRVHTRQFAKGIINVIFIGAMFALVFFRSAERLSSSIFIKNSTSGPIGSTDGLLTVFLILWDIIVIYLIVFSLRRHDLLFVRVKRIVVVIVLLLTLNVVAIFGENSFEGLRPPRHSTLTSPH